MTPYFDDPWLTVYAGDCREVLETLPSESVHCVVTSPPYWGLRDYGTASWIGGDEGCDHMEIVTGQRYFNGQGAVYERGGAPSARRNERPYRDTCRKCGATRQDSQLGLEATPEQYVESMVAVFREVRRVLRNDGTLWLNLGDSYSGSGKGGNGGSSSGLKLGRQARENPDYRQGFHNTPVNVPGLKPKDLVGIPWRVAFALQADGWYLRSDIIWSKPNPMPESVTDRPTKSHEYLFLLSKSERYFFDADAVRESNTVNPNWNYGSEDYRRDITQDEQKIDGDFRRPKSSGNGWSGFAAAGPDGNGRNIRSVWTIATQPYPGAHFATFPPKLVEPCIKAGSSEKGVCPECGAPWRRVVERTTEPQRTGEWKATGERHRNDLERKGGFYPTTTELGWQPPCVHDVDPVPATILDPFAGSGTVGMVAQNLSRRALLIDLNADYLVQCLRRNAQTPLGLSA